MKQLKTPSVMKEVFKNLQQSPTEYFKKFYDNCPAFDEIPLNFTYRKTDW